ncbi:hypothetical protein L2E82_48048 [Cichorium intybus]|uniref:Uncharacterized protein n=1 Tax=Cichorium intybus TaxID=13427 RepID=A0ACB8YXF2_CICIN|nr:hypothetical protein L2E82_48048 [Cichorium intybus]
MRMVGFLLLDSRNIEVGKRIEVGNESGGWRTGKRIEVRNESFLFSRNFSSAQVNPLQMENRYRRRSKNYQPPPVEELPMIQTAIEEPQRKVIRDENLVVTSIDHRFYSPADFICCDNAILRIGFLDKARVCEWLAPDNAIFDVCWIKDDTNRLW